MHARISALCDEEKLLLAVDCDVSGRVEVPSVWASRAEAVEKLAVALKHDDTVCMCIRHEGVTARAKSDARRPLKLVDRGVAQNLAIRVENAHVRAAGYSGPDAIEGVASDSEHCFDLELGEQFALCAVGTRTYLQMRLIKSKENDCIVSANTEALALNESEVRSEVKHATTTKASNPSWRNSFSSNEDEAL